MTDVPFTLVTFLLLAVVGAIAGFFGGLLGGSAFVLIAGLYHVFSQMPGIGHLAMPLTIGTTMACMIFTSIASILNHVQWGVVDFYVVKRFTPYITPSTMAGAALATLVKVYLLKVFFGVFCLYAALKLMLPSKPVEQTGVCMRSAKYQVAGSLIGTVCGMLGIGGTNLFVPYMLKRSFDARKALATATALQLPIALAGTLAFVVGGLRAGTPPGSVGFVYMPALAICVATSMLVTPLGVKASHALPAPMVKKVFGVFTAVIGVKMLWAV